MQELLPGEVLDESIVPCVKLLFVSLAGRLSGYQHTCVVRVDTNARTLHWLDACTTNDGITTEREEALGILREALVMADPAGAEAWRKAWRQWTGWGKKKASIPQQLDDSSCALFAYRFCQAFAAGQATMDPVPRCLELRGQVAQEIVMFAFAAAGCDGEEELTLNALD